jgi:molybdenum cofactor biosynthesis enzyme MoaA
MKQKINQLIKYFYKKFIPENVRNVIWHYKKTRPRKYLRIEVHLADHCNLSCKSCSHFSPLARENFLDILTFEKDSERLSKLTIGKIEELRLMGGEPLSHPKINEIVNISRKHFRFGKITIITNGLLLLSQDNDFWRNCRINNIDIQISQYPIKLDIEEIKKTAKQNDVNLIFSDKVEKFTNMQLDANGVQKINTNFKLCDQSDKCNRQFCHFWRRQARRNRLLVFA